MNDPVGALVTYLRDQPEVVDLIDDQLVSGAHLFGEYWDPGTSAIRVEPAGGTPAIYTPDRWLRVYVICYGPSDYEAQKVGNTLHELMLNFERKEVRTADSQILILSLYPDSELARVWEEDLSQPAVGFYVRIATVEV